MKINRKLLIKLTIYLLALRNPLIIITMLTYVMSDKLLPKKFVSHLVPFLISILGLILYSMSMGNETSNIFGQSRDILLCIVVFCFLLITSESSQENNNTIYISLKRCFVVIAYIKVIIILYTAKTGIPVSDVIEWIRDKWNIQMMSLGVKDSIIFRLQIPLDSAVPFFIYFATKEFIHDKINRLRNGLSLLMLLISMLLTLSRAFWGETIFFIFTCFLLETSIAFKVKSIFISIIGFMFVFFLTPIGNLIINIFNTRFGGSNNANASSDAERVWQNNALINSFYDSPIFGHGIGYYVPNVIRSVTTKYLYESQSLSMLMDLGVFGCVLIASIFLYYIIKSIIKDNGGIKGITMGIVFMVFWVISGSVNPLLFGASGGAILFMSAKFASLYRIKDENACEAK